MPSLHAFDSQAHRRAVIRCNACGDWLHTLHDQSYGWCPPCRRRLFSPAELAELEDRARQRLVDLEILRDAGDRLDLATAVTPVRRAYRRPCCERCPRRVRLADIRDGLASDRLCARCHRAASAELRPRGPVSFPQARTT